MPNDTAATEQMGEVELRRRVAELEEALRQSALILQAVIDHIPGLVYIRDTDSWGSGTPSCSRRRSSMCGA